MNLDSVLRTSSSRSQGATEKSSSNRGSQGKAASPSLQNEEQQQKPPPEQDNRYLTTIAVWRRKFYLWFKAVFITRKEYVPGDTCRFLWQTVPEVKRSFVYYRVGHMIGNLFVFVVSFFHIDVAYYKNECGNEPAVLCFGPFRLQFEWFFYATRWGIMINLAQSIWAMVLTFQVYVRQKKVLNQEMAKQVSPILHVNSLPTISERSFSQTKDSFPVLKSNADSATKEHKILSRTGFYWSLHSYAIIACAIIDSVYWTLLWPETNGTINERFFNEVSEHALNFFLMISDYCVVAFPVILTHVLLTISIPSLYLIVSYIYYVAGGKSEDHERRYLYPFVNWEKPVIALLFGLSLMILSSVILLLLLLIDHYKFKCRPQTLLNKNRTPSEHP